MWPFSRRRYDKDAEEVGPEAIRESFAAYAPYWWPLDHRYIRLYEESGKAFAGKYWADAGRYQKEVLDCDEIAFIGYAEWCKGAGREGFRLQPSMGLIVLRCAGSSIWHVQGFGDFKERLLRFEFQTYEWRTFETVEKVGMLIR